MTPLLLGISIAALLFGSLLWAGYCAYDSSGWKQRANLSCVVLTILVMATITYGYALPGQILGALLVVSGLAATFYDTRWSRLLPFTLVTLGVFALSGIPFS